MSRIHDALRKAQKERESSLQKFPGPVTTIPADEESGSIESASTHVAERVSGAEAKSSEEFIRFDQLRSRCAKHVWMTNPGLLAFARSNNPNAGAEQFRGLRSRLYLARENKPFRSLLVTSAVAGDGKTYVASNLAQAIAWQSDRRVLMIDADLRNSNLHKPFGASLGPGLSDYLSGKATEFEVLQFGGLGNLCLIPGGTPVSDPTELIAGERFGKLIERMAPVFEWIIVDSPPILPVSDAGILTRVCDSVLMVVGAGTTSVEDAQRACQAMREKNLLGIVLNRAEQAHAYSGQYPYKETKEMPV
ncbi:MAG: CpsD/CapB family tyrosine-protein kinase [Acidobacteriia bacterium]|nr:CpsD/CapB family tyrosine-protein kinase [Terriglobia bacterium]